MPGGRREDRAERLVFILLLVFVSEVALRLFYRFVNGAFLFERSALPIFVADDYRGWSVKPDLDHTHTTNEFSCTPAHEQPRFSGCSRPGRFLAREKCLEIPGPAAGSVLRVWSGSKLRRQLCRPAREAARTGWIRRPAGRRDHKRRRHTHWTPLGNRVAAQAVTDYLIDECSDLMLA